MRVVLALAWAGLRHRPGRWLLLAVGVALGAVLPVVAGGLRLTAESAAVTGAVEGLPADQRDMLAFDGANRGPVELAAVDVAVRSGWAGTGLPAPVRFLAFRPLAVAGSTFTLGATDTRLGGPDTPVRLTGGRQPAACTPQRCEVLLTSPAGLAPPPSARTLTPAAVELGLVITGTADLVDDRLVGAGSVDRSRPLLLGGSVAGLARLASLELFGRSVTWIGSLSGSTVTGIGVGQLSARVQAMTEALNTQFGGLTLRWPQDAAVGAQNRAQASAERFTVLGAGAAVLQLGFAVVAATGLRRRQQFVWRLLTRRGAGRIQLVAAPVLQVAVVVAAGVLAGIAAGAGWVAVRIADGAGSGGRGAVVADAVGQAAPTAVWFGLVAVGLTVAVALWPPGIERATRLVVDVITVGAVAVTVLVLTDSASRGSGGTGALTTSVTTLIAVTAGLVAARCWPLVTALVGWAGTGPRKTRRAVDPVAGPARSAGRRPTRGRRVVVARLAVLGGRRRSLGPAVAAGFIAAATCSVVFAGAYRATLVSSAQQQASFQVPLDVQVTASRDVVTPLSVLDVPALQAIGAGVRVVPVVSSAVTVFGGTNAAAGLPLTGLDPAVLPLMHDFAATTGASIGAAELAARLGAPVFTTGTGGPVLPAGSTRIDLAVAGLTAGIDVGLWVTDPAGTEQQILLRHTGSGLFGEIPAGPALRVTGLEILESSSNLMHRQHTTGEGSTDLPLPTGTLRLGAVRADGRVLGWSWAGWGGDQLTVTSTPPAGVDVAYQIGENRTVISPGFLPRTALPALPVAADPATAAAARDGRLTVEANGLTVTAQIVAVLPRLPTLGLRFLLADRSAVAALLDRSAPGTAAVEQVWLAAPPTALPAVTALLATGPPSTATITLRADIAATLAADPVATRSATVLTAAGLLAMLLALTAVAASVQVDRREAAPDHLSYEVDGLPPPALRKMLVDRAAVIIALGVPVGALAGAGLTSAAISLLQVNAGGGRSTPPLLVDLDGRQTLLVLAGTVLAALIVAAGAAAGEFREHFPALPEADQR